MIKTFKSDNLEALDKDVNDFMASKGKDLPVRTEVYVADGKIWHKATVFWDGVRDSLPGGHQTAIQGAGDTQIPEVHVQALEDVDASEGTQTVKKQASDNKLGALWWQKSGELTGKFNNQAIAMPQNVIGTLNTEGKATVTIQGETAVVIKNQYKKTDKHPDFVILRKRD